MYIFVPEVHNLEYSAMRKKEALGATQSGGFDFFTF